MNTLWHDLRYGGRMFVKHPLFTLVVVLTLALGIGLNTAVFSAVEAQLLRPPPGVRDANELLMLYRNSPGARWWSNSVPHYMALRERTTDVFSSVAAHSLQSMNITVGGVPRTVIGLMVSANYFSTLGTPAAQGRVFRPDEDIGHGAHPVIVLSDGFWRGTFAADPQIVGKQVPVNGLNVTVVGVTPPRFRGLTPIVEPAFFIPLMQLAQVQPSTPGDPFESRNNFMDVTGRVRPGVSVAQATARVDAVNAQLRAERPDDYKNRGITVVPQPDMGIHPSMRTAQVGLVSVVVVIVGILLLLACINVANLFLARANDRAREMAIRVALGAGRAALIRQMLVESVLYAAAAGAIGLLIATWTIALVNGIRVPMAVEVRPDLTLSMPVLVATGVVTLITAVAFGLAPALHATRPSLVPALKGEAAAGGSRSRASRALIIAQTALSIVLLVGAGLFLGNLRRASTLEKGFVGDRLLLASFDPSLQGYQRGAAETFYRQLTERLAASPDVEAIGLTSDVPLGLGGSDRGVEVPGYVPRPQESMSIFYSSVAPGYFASLQIPVSGRDFALQDDSSAVPVLIVNERFAERFWPGQSAIGKTVRTAQRLHTVVGVVPTGKYRSLGEDATAYMWFAHAQAFRTEMDVVIRTRGRPDALIPAVRAAVAALDVNMPVNELRTMDEHLSVTMLPARITGLALGAFGAIGLLLAAVGIYGVMAYSVSQRTREIGIRMAIGATANAVVRLLLSQGMRLVLIGTAMGLVAAVGASRLVRSMLYGADGLEPVTFVVVPLLLLAVAAVATFVPARRAALVDPAITLRAD